MSWRPEGWDIGGNPKIDGVQYYNFDEDSFEAGADAMLEALMQRFNKQYYYTNCGKLIFKGVNYATTK